MRHRHRPEQEAPGHPAALVGDDGTGSLRRPLAFYLCLLTALTAPVSGCRSLAASTIGVAEIEAQPLAARLNDERAPLLLDVRDHDSFFAGHIPGAVSVHINDLDGFLNSRGPTREHSLVTVCRSGRRSLLAASIASAHGYTDVASLAGGMLRWRALGLPVTAGAETTIGTMAPPRIQLSLCAQVAEVVAGFVIKPLYMIVALALIVLLRHQRSTELSLVRFGLISFLVGELACAANFTLTTMESDALELVHGLGMVGMNALIPWGLFLLLDRRVLRLLDPDAPCVAVRFCGTCWKREAVTCPAQRLFLFGAPALILVSLMPFAAPIRVERVVNTVFGTDLPVQVSLLLQLVQFRLYPLIAALLLALTTVLLFRGGQRGPHRAQLPFFVGLGFLGFAFMRWLLLHAYRATPAWADVWEELTELIAILGIVLLLWLIRRQYGFFGRFGQSAPVTER